MIIKSTCLIIIAGISATPTYAGSSEQHFSQSANHSAQAASHGSQAVLSATATVLAVPIIAFGASVAISGAALEEVGEGSLTLGNDLLHVDTLQKTNSANMLPDGAPTLD